MRYPDAGFVLWIICVLQRYSSFLVTFCIPRGVYAARPDKGNGLWTWPLVVLLSAPAHCTTPPDSFCCYPLGPAGSPLEQDPFKKVFVYVISFPYLVFSSTLSVVFGLDLPWMWLITCSFPTCPQFQSLSYIPEKQKKSHFASNYIHWRLILTLCGKWCLSSQLNMRKLKHEGSLSLSKVTQYWVAAWLKRPYSYPLYYIAKTQ